VDEQDFHGTSRGWKISLQEETEERRRGRIEARGSCQKWPRGPKWTAMGRSLCVIPAPEKGLVGEPLSGRALLKTFLTHKKDVLVGRVQEQLHDLSLNLRPSMLDDLGLEPALNWNTERQAARGGLQAEVRLDPLERRLDPEIETE